jgi:hypothetical protein
MTNNAIFTVTDKDKYAFYDGIEIGQTTVVEAVFFNTGNRKAGNTPNPYEGRPGHVRLSP